MATYKGIKGFSIQNLSADPSNPIEGEMWYNSTSNVWKESTLTTTGAWASGTNLPTAMRDQGQAGTTSALISFGGVPYATTGLTFEYDGSSWTAGGDLNFSRQYVGACGTLTSTLAFGGERGATGCYGPNLYATCKTEEYNGTSWSNANDNIVDGGATNLGGTQIDATTAGASNSNPNRLSTYVYDGTSWTSAAANMNTGLGPTVARMECGILGNSGSDLIFAGGSHDTGPPSTAAVESWNGTSWTTVGSLNTSRTSLGGAGSTTEGIVFGGKIFPSTYSSATEQYDGSTWTSVASLATGRTNASGNRGTVSSTLAVGGTTAPGAVVTVEEWTGPGAPLTQTITVS
jgi:hypothetical protein